MEIIKIKGVKDISKFENYVASSLVDIAYFEEAKDDTILLSIESNISLDNEDDKKWLAELINKALIECQEPSAKVVW